ncbi:hypothetical protein KIN20_029147 [Parelaphostrongylus tenuis]|uniref:Uncharacterized protein n=1 Tax=Parelaphostrongylus tenuis TaxID=148309 RepID=A0AAD5MVI7_PARTN|nr:hypothetical protein KIN20_025617 [Parelaphostrongylus tenuis]KAJ1368085.1 hypothetical protein KIN20_029147 [Parelaphostrongylus tenuis]
MREQQDLKRSKITLQACDVSWWMGLLRALPHSRINCYRGSNGSRDRIKDTERTKEGSFTLQQEYKPTAQDEETSSE